MATGISCLPTELVEIIAANLDDGCLLAFASCSRTFREKSFHVYANRFFHTIKFCLYPTSLDALVAISRSKYSQFVQNVAFGTEYFGLIDPIHDDEVIDGRNFHPDPHLPRATLEDLEKFRRTVDAEFISIALRKFRRLVSIAVGHALRDQDSGKPIRKTYGIKSIPSWPERRLHCPSRHCRPTRGVHNLPGVLKTVTLALHKLPPSFRRPKFALGAQILDVVYFKDMASIEGILTQKVYIDQLPRHLQFDRHLAKNDPENKTAILFQMQMGSFITSLDARYDQSLFNPRTTTCTFLAITMPYLRKLTFCGAYEFVNLWRRFFVSNKTLEQISLVNCGVKQPHQVTDEATWKPVLGTIYRLPKLQHLHLQNLFYPLKFDFWSAQTKKSYISRGFPARLLFDPPPPPSDASTVINGPKVRLPHNPALRDWICATWKCREDTVEGLRSVITNFNTVPIRHPSPQSPGAPCPTWWDRHYVDFRSVPGEPIEFEEVNRAFDI